MPGQSQKAGWTVGVTAPVGPVRGLFRAPSVGWSVPVRGPHGPGTRRPRTHSGRRWPRTRLERRMRWSVPGDLGRSDGL